MAVTRRERNARRDEAEAVKLAAYANPATICCNCARTLNHCGPNGDGRNANGTPCTWDAGHPDGRWGGNRLRAECSACNRARGATDGNRKREPHSFVW